MVGRGRGIDGLGGIGSLGGILLLGGVDWGSLVGDISDKAVVSVSGVGDSLDTAIGKVDPVRSSHVSGSILRLSSVERSLGVVISNSVLEGVGLRGLIVDLSLGVVSRGSVVDRGSMVGGGNLHDGSSVVGRGSVVDRGSMVSGGNLHDGSGVVGRGRGISTDRGSVVGNGATVVGSSLGGGNLMESLVVIGLSHGGVGSSESLGLVKSPGLSIGLK